MLDHLVSEFQLGIITNGAPDLQWEKINGGNLKKYFKHIIISGEVNYGKPDKQIFNVALNKFQVNKESVIMIGDSIDSDIEGAKASGIKVSKLDTLMTVLIAITVVLGMKIVGILLVSALLVIPAAAALQVSSSFKQAIVLSSYVSVATVVLGLLIAFYLDLPASGTIVVLSFIFFLAFFIVKGGKSFLRA